MRKILTAVLTFAIVIILSGVASANFSYDEFKRQTDFFSVSEVAEEHYAFIDAEPLSTIEERSFEHKYASPEYYSYFYNDLIVFDYDQADAQPIWRLWIEYAGTKHIYTNSVTFSFDGKDYTFADILDQQWISQFDNDDASQSIMIIFGTSNSQFLTDLFDYISNYLGSDWSLDNLYTLPLAKMTLHGTENIPVELPASFYFDFLMIYSLYDYDGHFEEFLQMTTEPTPLTISSTVLSPDTGKSVMEKQVIEIPEHGLVTELPESFHWATMTEGDYEGLGTIYHKTPEQAKKYIETMGHCLMGFDPDSDLRISISVVTIQSPQHYGTNLCNM